MQQPTALAAHDIDQEYRAIEAALLESPRGRWFLTEHGRRARRLDSALLDDAIGRLQSSLRQPPALLGQLKAEIEELQAFLGDMRTQLLARSGAMTPQKDAASEVGGASQTPPVRSILKAAEDMHELAWSLQAVEIDPEGCEAIARHATMIYAMSHAQALESERVRRCAERLEMASVRLGAVLQTVLDELRVDEGGPTANLPVPGP